VAVLGSGTIGLMAIAAARAMGAGKIIATARYDRQAEMAKALGADETVSDSGPEFRAAIDECTDGRGADLTIETIGGHQGKTVQQSIDVTRILGRIVILGGHRRPIELDYIIPLRAEHSIIFSNCYSVIDGRHDYEIAIEMMASGHADVRQTVTHRYPLQEIQTAFESAFNKGSGSIKVQIQQG
jgi:threonine dehydrogenase-like Zn-dependent dehydrogenase